MGTAHEHSHAHDHHPDHSHGESEAGYYVEQIATIAACGFIGAIAVIMWWASRTEPKAALNILLVPAFHVWVLIGGAILLALTAIRAVTLWIAVGQAKPLHTHDHDHSHEHNHGECHHDHGDCAHDHHGHAHHHHGHDHGHHAHHHHRHDHEHSHDHGFAPWRCAVLLLPIVLFMLNLPNQGFSSEHIKRMLGDSPDVGGIKEIADKGNGIRGLAFSELAAAAYNPAARQELEGQTGQLKGQFFPLGNDKEFTLYRLKMTCCASDAIPLKVKIISPVSLSSLGLKQMEWVEVTGQIQYRQVPGRSEHIPVVQLRSADGIQRTGPASDYE